MTCVQKELMNMRMQYNKKIMRISLCLVLSIMMLTTSINGFTIRSGTNSRTLIRNDNLCVFGSMDEGNSNLEIKNDQGRKIKKNLKRKCIAGGLGLALTTSLSLVNTKSALAMGPNLAGPSMQKEVTGMELAEKMSQLRAARIMAAEKKAQDDEGTKIFKEKGSDAYQEFLNECEAKRVAEKERRVIEREELIRDLILVQEVDPFKSLKGKAALYMFDHGIDLYKVPGTEQEAFERLKKMFPEKYGDVEARQKEATRAKVQQFRDQGLEDDDIVSQFLSEGNKYAKIGDGRGRDLDNLQSMRDRRKNKKTNAAKTSTVPASPTTQSQTTTSQSEPDNNVDQSTVTQEKVATTVTKDDAAQTKAEAKAAKQKEKEEAKAIKQKEKAEAKAAKLEAKEKAKIEADKQKQLAKEKKAEAKALKEKEKSEKKAAKVAAAAATGAAAAVTAAIPPSSLPSTEIPSTSETSTTAIEKQETTASSQSENIIDQQESEEEADASDSQQLTTLAPTSTESMLTANNYKIPKIIAGTSFIGASSFVSFKIYNERSKEKELERQRQFDLLMGTTSSTSTDEQQSSSANTIITDQEPPVPTTPSEPTIPESPPPPPPADPYANADPNVEVDIQTPAPQFLTKKSNKKSSPPVKEQPIAKDTNQESTSLPPSHDKKKGRGGTIANLFKKNSTDKRPTTLAKVYSSTPHASFAQTLAQVLTLGAPGRFPDVKPPQPPNESLQTYKDNLINIKTQSNIPNDQAAEIFANVVNSMLIHIVDLASSTVVNTNKKNTKKKSENDKIVVDGVSVVLDFMDFGAQLYEDLFNDYVISPVTYSGALSKSKLENLFSTYATAQMTNFDSGLANNQDRIDTLQRVFNIPDKRAEGLLQKTLMKNFMTMMKDGGDSDGGAMAEMMKGLAGADGSFPGQDGSNNADVNPEDIQQSIKLMKELMESGSISKEEIALVKDQFSEVYGTDINKFLQEAEGEEDNLDDDGKELLNLFKDVLKKII